MRNVRLSAALLLTIFASLASAQGITRVRPPDEATLWTTFRNNTVSAASLGGHVLPTRGFTFTAVSMQVTTVGGGGAGNSVITLTDGTNTCTATFACSVTASTGAFRAAVANGAGTGCSYAPGAAITSSVSTAGCTTTQPTVTTITFVGTWK